MWFIKMPLGKKKTCFPLLSWLYKTREQAKFKQLFKRGVEYYYVINWFHFMKYSFTQKWKCHLLSYVRLFVTPWTGTHQASLSMEFSRQEYWSGLPFPSPGDLPDPGMEPRSPTLKEDYLPSEPTGKAICLKINTDLKIKQWPWLQN